MDSTPQSMPAPAPGTIPSATPPPARPLGGFRDLLIFLLGALLLFLFVQSAALYLVAWDARQESPELPWPELIRQVAERHQFNAFFAVPVQFAFYIFLLLLLYGLVRVRCGLPFWSGLKVRPLPTKLAGQALAAGFALALLINALNLLFPPPETLAFDRLFTTRAAALLVMGASLVMAPIVEELVFRGYIYTLLENLWGATPAVLASGLLFGFIHFPQLWPGYFQMLLISVVGLVLSLARARTGTTLASIVLHFGYNATISLFFVISPTFRALPAAF
jgi:membrane protease YdiL (CAAX protease family)